MIVGRVIGNVVCSVKTPALEGRKLMIVQPLDQNLKEKGKAMIAVDTVQSGYGDVVLVIDEGNSARMITDYPGAPIRTVIVGIIDALEKELRE